MIQEKGTATIEGNLTGTKHAMGIAAGATSHIMDILSKNLYSDPEMAVIREYSTNALDAHIEAGETRPIEVTLPTHLSQFLKIRDYGVGLNEDDIREIYSQYGESTKRGTNDQTGMLGLGCKSAFAYTSQFTVESVKDGNKIIVVVSRDEDGTGMMTVADEFATDEPNGTTVIVPTKAYNSFAAKASQLYRFWDEGTVLVNGEQPKRIDGFKLSDNIIVTREHQSFIVMGGVPYPVSLDHKLSYSNSLVVFVPIGSVEFTPAREALMYTPKTKAYIEQVMADYREACTGAIQREVDKTNTPQEALATVTRWGEILPATARSAQYTYKGKDIPAFFQQQNMVLVRENASKLSEHQNTDKVASTVFNQTLWVTDYDRMTFTAGQKKKLVHWADENGVNVNYFALMPNKKVPTDWIKPDMVIDWATISAVKLPRKIGSVAGRLPGSYDIYEDGEIRAEVTSDEFDTTNLMYYTGKAYDCEKMVEFLAQSIDTFTVVTFYSNREAKFLRMFPDTPTIQSVLNGHYKGWLKTLKLGDKLAMHIQSDYSLRHAFAALDPAKVDDPAVKKACKLVKRDVSSVKNTYAKYQSLLGVHMTTVFKSPLSNYPLFDAYELRNKRNAEDVYLYMNAKYAAMQQKESK